MLCVLTGHVLRRDPPFCCGDMNLWVKSRSTITEHPLMNSEKYCTIEHLSQYDRSLKAYCDSHPQ